jgi:acyl transferase domain-containing protein
MMKLGTNGTGKSIAIVGMSGRFPRARDLGDYWRNLRDGTESISSLSDHQAGSHVKAGAWLEDIELFDAAFFGFNPNEAKLIDPQQRIFMECAWEALENAGYVSAGYEGLIGVYAGVGMNTYLLNNLLPNGRRVGLTDLVDPVDAYQNFIANDKDFLSTRVSYKMDLRGPSLVIQTACSSSLVAIHVACQSLLNYECDIALAGGISIRPPQKAGYLYQDGMIYSSDVFMR